MRKLQLGLLAGLAVSAALYGLLSLLLFTTRAPTVASPSSATSIGAWASEYASYVSAYASWQNFYVLLATASGISLLAAIELAAAFLVVRFSRLAYVASVALLNFYFAWTSHLVQFISSSVAASMGNLMAAQAQFLWTWARLAYLMSPFSSSGPEVGWSSFSVQLVQLVADLDALTLLGALAASAYLVNRGEGPRSAVLHALQVTALSLTLLGAEIALFDSNELFLHVTEAQWLLDFLPSFTNADLLLSAAAALGVSTWLLTSRHGHAGRI